MEETLPEALKAADVRLRDYYAYVMLDFIASDHERTEPALAWAFGIAESLELDERLSEIAAKELKLTKKVLQDVKRNRTRLVEAARREFAPGAEGES